MKIQASEFISYSKDLTHCQNNVNKSFISDLKLSISLCTWSLQVCVCCVQLRLTISSEFADVIFLHIYVQVYMSHHQ